MSHTFATTEAIKICDELLSELSPPKIEEKEYVPFRTDWKYVESSKVKDMLVSVAMGNTSRDILQIFDVRDDTTDFNGGNLITAKNVPCNTFLSNLGHLFNEYHTRKEILIHCMYSQQRGIKCANWYRKGIEELVNHYMDPNKVDMEYPAQFFSLNDVALSDELIANLSNQKVFVFKGGFNRILNKYVFNTHTAQIFENWDESQWKFHNDISGKKFVHIHDM